jgi:hypothetical protein
VLHPPVRVLTRARRHSKPTSALSNRVDAALAIGFTFIAPLIRWAGFIVTGDSPAMDEEAERM